MFGYNWVKNKKTKCDEVFYHTFEAVDLLKFALNFAEGSYTRSTS